MATKTSLRGIVVDHLDTLRDARTHRVSVLDLLMQFGVPVTLGLGLRKFHPPRRVTTIPLSV
jgi:hypothetical protein